MTSPRRFEHDLPALLADMYVAGTPDYRDDLVQQVARVRQRPAWTFPERWLPMDLTTKAVPGAPRVPWRIVGVLALLAVLLAAMLAVYIGLTAAASGAVRSGRERVDRLRHRRRHLHRRSRDRQDDRDRRRPGDRRSTRLLAGRHSRRLRAQGRGRWRRPARNAVRGRGRWTRARPGHARAARRPRLLELLARRPLDRRVGHSPSGTRDHGRGERRQRPAGVLRCRANVERRTTADTARTAPRSCSRGSNRSEHSRPVRARPRNR